MIRELDQVDTRRTGAALMWDLVAEGEPAVEPLLAALETETRLTRTVTFWKGFSIEEYYVEPVFDSEFFAMRAILKTDRFDRTRYRFRQADAAPRTELVRSMRDFWSKNGVISVIERSYLTLRDDAAGRARWLESAAGIIQSRDDAGPATDSEYRRPGRRDSSPMKGEELRSRRDPSVSELLARRVLDIAQTPRPETTPDIVLHDACSLALMLARWDEKAALPVIRTMMTRARELIDEDRGRGHRPDHALVEFVARFAVIRAHAAEREALDEYAAEIRRCVPDEVKLSSIVCFEPMWTDPDDPAICDVARSLFNDPRSPWVPLLRDPRSRFRGYNDQAGLYASPLLRVASFRDALIAAMADRTVIGAVRRDEHDVVLLKTDNGGRNGFEASAADLEGFERGVDRPFRFCDQIAWEISSVEGSPRCELYWPEDRRDRAVTSCVDFLKTYGDRFTPDPPGVEAPGPRPSRSRAYLAFPALGRPATREDVRNARAIFSLEGEGEVRLVNVPALPFRARWITLKDLPIDRRRAGGVLIRDYDQDGWIWQAEEVRKGDHWERYFGFVGRHAIARVPASELELARSRTVYEWGELTTGLDARLEPVDRRGLTHDPGEPILVIVKIRNRRAVESASPREFLRPGADGRPALRRGVTIEVKYSDPERQQRGWWLGGPAETLKPTRADHFDPGDATRPLAPFEVFDAARLDLNDWFDLTRPGSYHVHLAFAADSGFGEGESNDWDFRVGYR